MWLALKAFVSTNALKIAGYVAALAGMALVMLRIRQSGRDAERAEATEEAINMAKRAKDAQTNVDAMADADVTRRLRERWSRKSSQ